MKFNLGGLFRVFYTAMIIYEILNKFYKTILFSSNRP